MMDSGIGDRFQTGTKYDRDRIIRERPERGRRPARHKIYSDVEKIVLPEPERDGGTPLWRTIRQRRSVRNFGPEALSLPELSQLLWAVQGVTGRINAFALRAAPSAGALYPTETYLIVNSVAGLEPGIYHFDAENHALACLRKGSFAREASAAALGQHMAARAAVVFLWSSVFDRAKWKYGQRAYRYVYLDAGHIAQNLALAAVALGLGSCQIGAFFDDELNELIGLDGENESVIYLSVVGRPGS